MVTVVVRTLRQFLDNRGTHGAPVLFFWLRCLPGEVIFIGSMETQAKSYGVNLEAHRYKEFG